MKVFCATATLLLLVGLFAETIMESEASNVCSQKIETGPCRARVPSWGFARGTCVEFIYGGCDGTENRFDTQADCEAECVH